MAADVWQVVLSVKSAAGIPVPADTRSKDVLQRSLRACLFYQPPRDVDADAGGPPPQLQDHFLGNAFQTLAKQHPHKEEVWQFPESSREDGNHKFIVRTDFWDERDVHCRVSQERLFVLLELTCTIRTPRPAIDGADTGVRGPLKNFSAKQHSAAKGSDSDSGGGHASGRCGGRRRWSRNAPGSAGEDSDVDASGDDDRGGGVGGDSDSSGGSSEGGGAKKKKVTGRKGTANGKQRNGGVAAHCRGKEVRHEICAVS
ncbi:unnamed protein product [Phaeothamnion confervicola]